MGAAGFSGKLATDLARDRLRLQGLRQLHNPALLEHQRGGACHGVVGLSQTDS